SIVTGYTRPGSVSQAKSGRNVSSQSSPWRSTLDATEVNSGSRTPSTPAESHITGGEIVNRTDPSASSTTYPPRSSGSTVSPGADSSHRYSGAVSGAASSTIDSFTPAGST